MSKQVAVFWWNNSRKCWEPPWEPGLPYSRCLFRNGEAALAFIKKQYQNKQDFDYNFLIENVDYIKYVNYEDYLKQFCIVELPSGPEER